MIGKVMVVVGIIIILYDAYKEWKRDTETIVIDPDEW